MPTPPASRRSTLRRSICSCARGVRSPTGPVSRRADHHHAQTQTGARATRRERTPQHLAAPGNAGIRGFAREHHSSVQTARGFEHDPLRLTRLGAFQPRKIRRASARRYPSSNCRTAFCATRCRAVIAIRTNCSISRSSISARSRHGAERVQAICDWVHDNIEYRQFSGSPTTAASDIVAQRFGVCRDFAHTTIALCRTFNMPTRATCRAMCRISRSWIQVRRWIFTRTSRCI